MTKLFWRRVWFSLCLFSLLIPSPILSHSSSAQTKKFELTVDSIMRANDLIGYEPSRPYWSQDSQRLYFRWKRAGEARLKEPDLYVVNRDGSGLRKFSEDEAKQAPPAFGELSKDKRLSVFAEEGDVFLYDHAKNERRQIIATVEGENAPRFTADQKHVLFVRQNNLYRMSLEGGALTQLTDIRTGGGAPPDSPPKGTDSQEYLKKEERALLEAVRERAQNREEQEAKRKAREKRKPFSPPAGQAVAGLTLSPDGKYVIATVFQSASGAKNTIVPNYITESAYTEDIPSRSKVGDAQGRNRMVIISVETGEAAWIDHGQKQAAEANAQAAPPASSNTPQGPPRRPQERERDVPSGRARPRARARGTWPS